MLRRSAAAFLTVCILFMCAASCAGSYSSTIADIHASFVSGNRSASSAPQQIANGAYRCVELLELIAAEAGVSSTTIQSIHSSFVSGNRSASSAPQQHANGMYRCVELLEAIAYALDE